MASASGPCGATLGDGWRPNSRLGLMHLEGTQVIRRCQMRRAAEEGSKRLDVANVVVLRLLDKVTHRHVFDHAGAQWADGLLAHLRLLVLRLRFDNSSILRPGCFNHVLVRLIPPTAG